MKYKHKQTGYIAEYLPKGNSYDGEEGYVVYTGQCEPKLPCWVVENTGDWEKLSK